MIKNFNIFKVKEKRSESGPDYTLSANIGTKEAPVNAEIGAGWIKQGKNGSYISVKMSEAWSGTSKTGEPVERKGFVVAEDKSTGSKLDELHKQADAEGINPDDIPF